MGVFSPSGTKGVQVAAPIQPQAPAVRKVLIICLLLAPFAPLVLKSVFEPYSIHIPHPTNHAECQTRILPSAFGVDSLVLLAFTIQFVLLSTTKLMHKMQL